MKVAVRYFSKSGNTKRVAGAIARAAGCKAKSIPAPLEEPVDVLFLGASEYAGDVSQKVKVYVRTLTPDLVGKVVIFSTSAMTKKVYPKLSKRLTDRGIEVEERYFYCPGKFLFFHGGHPNKKDLKDAQNFVKDILKED